MRRSDWLLPLGLAALAACQPKEDDGPTKDDAPADDAVCVDDATHFETKVWAETLQPVCIGCHTADGAAANSDLVLVPATRPDHLTVNRAALEDVAGLERDDQSIILRKPLGLDSHGGGKVLDGEDDPRFQNLVAFVQRMGTPTVCEDDGGVIDPSAGLALLDEAATLRKAALILVGHLPTEDALDRASAGGDDALVTELWQLMGEDVFVDVFVERLNDVLLTDRYLSGTSAIGIFDDTNYPGVYWYEAMSDNNRSRNAVNDAIAREPLMLAAHLIENDRPWTELLTADYTMVNAFNRRAWGLADVGPVEVGHPESERFHEVTVPGFKHAGILSMPAFLARYPTTDTNRNRHRSWFFYKTFLATDILTFADRPIDPSTSATHNPTLNDSQCTVCHATMDPVAGAFQNWDEEGRYRPPENGWYTDLAEPGFGETTMPSSAKPEALAWLAQQAVADPRFGAATVRLVLDMYARVPLLDATTAREDEELKAALALQDAFISEVATELADRGWDIKYAIERVLLSRYFRAAGEGEAVLGALTQAGTAHLLTPEELERKIESTTGLPWASGTTSTPYLYDRYNMLYGGIDSFAVIDRLEHANGVMAAIGRRMSTKMACEAVPRDLVLNAAQRRLLPHVEASYTPTTDDGFTVPEAEAAIKRNIQHLHKRLLGESLAIDDPEIEQTWGLWVDVWRAGQEGIASGEISTSMDYNCQARNDWWSGDELPSDRQVRNDPDYTVRAWIAVVSYLLTDWRFLYE